MKYPGSLLLLALSLVVGCSKAALLAPTGSTVTLSVNQTTVPINGQIQVLASVVEVAGTAPQDGTSVTFTGSFGSFDPVEAKTVGGIARTTFTGLTSGTAKIGAFSGNAKATEVEVRVGTAAAKSLTLAANPSSVSQSGGVVTIAATVLDEAGNTVPGVAVTFSSDTGQLNPTTVVSDASGIARTQLSTTQTAKVTATAGGASKEVTVTASTAPTVTIGPPTPPSPFAGQPVTFEVTATSGATGAPRQVQTLEVNFGDGQVETRSNVTGATAFTHTYNREGAYTVTARAVDTGGNTGLASRAIVVGFAPSPTISTFSSNPTSGTTATPFTISVNAQPSSSSNAPIRSVVVRTSDGSVVYSSSSGGSQQFSVSFSTPGAKTLTATATDANGQTVSSSIVINVS